MTTTLVIGILCSNIACFLFGTYMFKDVISENGQGWLDLLVAEVINLKREMMIHRLLLCIYAGYFIGDSLMKLLK